MIGPAAPAAGCERTEALLQAERDGRLADELATHAAGCAECSDALVVGTLLREDAAVAYGQARVPSSAVAWWRASLAERHREEQRALRPIAIWEWVSAVLVAGLLWVLLRGTVGTFVAERGGSWVASLLEPLAGLASLASAPWLVGLGLAIPALAVLGGLVWAVADG